MVVWIPCHGPASAGPGWKVDFSLDGAHLCHDHLPQLMESIDDLLLPWKVDLLLAADQNQDLRAHLLRVGMVVLQRTAGHKP